MALLSLTYSTCSQSIDNLGKIAQVEFDDLGRSVKNLTASNPSMNDRPPSWCVGFISPHSRLVPTGLRLASPQQSSGGHPWPRS